MNRRIVAIASSMSLLAALLAGCEKDPANDLPWSTTTLESSARPDDGWQPEQPPADPAAPPAFTREQLEQLVAPVALYPDALLMEILMAATYPAEVGEAAIWAKEHPNLVGKELDDAIADKNWDVSVKAVTHAPKALELMAADPQWTRDLGDAFLAQQNDVLNAVQVLRQKACDLGNLKTTAQQQVVIEEAPPPAAPPATTTYVVPPPQQVVRILPAQQNVFYVPVYNPRVIYGPPPPTIYYPRAWLYPSFNVGLAPVISFGVGLTIGALLWGDADWYHGRVYHHHHWYDHRRDYYRYDRPYRADYWRHDPYHRRGVSYPSRYVEGRVFEHRDDAVDRFRRGSRDFEGRTPRSGGWDRALADDSRSDRLRDWQRDRDRDRDRDRVDRDGRERFDRGDRVDGRDRDGRGWEKPGADRRGPDRRREDQGRMDRDRGPSRGADRPAIDRRGEPGRTGDQTGRGDRGAGRAPGGPRDREGQQQDRGKRAPDRQPDRADSAPDRARPDRGADRVQPDRPSGRGSGRDADRPSVGRGSGASGQGQQRGEARPGGGRERDERIERPDAGSRGQGAGRSSAGPGASRSPGVSGGMPGAIPGKGPADRTRPESARPGRPAAPPASPSPSYRSPGGDRSRESQGSGRSVAPPRGGGERGDAPSSQRGNAPSMQRGNAPSNQRGNAPSNQRGSAPSMQRGGDGPSGQPGGRGGPGSGQGSSMQRGAPSRGGPGGDRDSRGSSNDDPRGNQERARGR